jgi:hypothetical protein
LHGKYEISEFPAEFSTVGNVFISPGAMDPVPDRAIVSRVKNYDPDLKIEWDRYKERWVITGPNKRKFGKREHLMTVQNDDHSYRPLDHRVITLIVLADSERQGDVKTFLRTLEENERHLSIKQQREYSEKLQYMAKDDLYRAYFGSTARGTGVNFEEL